MVFFDLKNLLLKSSVSICPPELINHADAQNKPGTAMNKFGRAEKLG